MNMARKLSRIFSKVSRNISRVWTYHYNATIGSKIPTVSFKDTSTGAIYGPWPQVGYYTFNGTLGATKSDPGNVAGQLIRAGIVDAILFDVDSLMQVKARSKGITLTTIRQTPIPATIQSDDPFVAEELSLRQRIVPEQKDLLGGLGAGPRGAGAGKEAKRP